jgi:hypothetical protein
METGRAQERSGISKIAPPFGDKPEYGMTYGCAIGANRINQHRHIFASTQKSERRGFDRTFGHGPNQDKLVSPQLTQHSVGSGLVKRIETAFA